MANFKKYKIIFTFIYLTTILKNVKAANEIIDCSNGELVTSVFNEAIDMTLAGIIKIYENVTINEILTTSNNEFDVKYIDARLEFSDNVTNLTKNLVIFTTDSFENYAKEQTATRISLKINLGCGLGKERTLIFFQPLKEGNYFSPIFSQTLYELSIPTPIFAGFDLTAFLEITATDDDLTRNQIVFTSNDSSQHYISVGTKNLTSADKKTSFANLTLDRIYLELPQPIKFEIVATDNGDPPKSSTALIVIRSDPNRSLPPQPKFIQDVYKGLIDTDFEMEPIHIKLYNGTYSTEVTYYLNGFDAKFFQLTDNKNGSVHITWDAQNLNKSEILLQKSWEFEIKTEHKNLVDFSKATIQVELADFQNYFHFMSIYYEGVIDEMGNLEISPIIFNPFVYKPDIDFILLENPKSYFSLTTNVFSIQLQLNNNFTFESVELEGFLRLALHATWENLSSMTYIVIKLPSVKQQQMFQFEKPLYVANFNETYGFELETIVFQTDVNVTQQIVYNISGDGSNFFKIQVDPNENQLKVQANFSTESLTQQLNSSFYLVLSAKAGDSKAFTTLVVKAPTEQSDSIHKKVFLTPSIFGKLLINNTKQNLSLDAIFINDVENLKDYRFYLAGDESLNFEMNINLLSHKIDLKLQSSLTDYVVDTKQFLTLYIQAVLPGSEHQNETLLVIIELPKKECPSLIIPSPDPPKFSNTNYVFTAFTNQTGSLGVVNALSKGSNATFQYILEVQSDILAQKLSINPFTGELMLYGIIEEGNYLFNITAVNVNTLEDAHVKGLLKIQAQEECRQYEGIAVEKTLLIIHIDEEKPYYGLFDMKFNENCSFHIEEMWPNDKDYVQVNEIFNMLDAIAIDREDPIFANMSEAQITIKLRLSCDKEDMVKSMDIKLSQPTKSRASEIIISEDINYAPDIMYLHIKIDDINDNAPEFKLSKSPQYLGYPSGNVTLDIYPEYLTKIEALDRDLGFNAKIKYRMRENAYFDIESETGKIYPKGKMLSTSQQTELIVLATDQGGEGLMSATVVIVKALTPDFYSLLTIKDNTTKSIKEIENELSVETGYNMNIIKMSYIPQMEKRLNDNQGLTCKAWIYAYKSHQLVQCKELQDKLLDKIPDASIVNIESYEEVALQSPPDSPTNMGYISAVAVLSVISGASIIFIVWRFYLYPSVNTKCVTKPDFALTSHENGQQINAVCSHGADKIQDCLECNNQRNHVKFNDLVESVIIVEECHQK